MQSARISPNLEAKIRANIDVHNAGGFKSSSRSLYALYNSKSVKKASLSRQNIDANMAENMEQNQKSQLEHNNIMVMSRVNETSWKYCTPEQYEKQMLLNCKMQNGGRDISQTRKDKYCTSKVFNYN